MAGCLTFPLRSRGDSTPHPKLAAVPSTSRARVRNVPEGCTRASCAPCTVNLLGALMSGSSVSRAISAAAASAKPGAALIPVPTAVPPTAATPGCALTLLAVGTIGFAVAEICRSPGGCADGASDVGMDRHVRLGERHGDRVLAEMGEGALDVVHQQLRHVAADALADHHAHHRDVLGPAGQREGRNLPATLQQPVGQVV